MSRDEELANRYLEDFRSGIPETTLSAAKGILEISKRHPGALTALVDPIIFVFEKTHGISEEGRLGPINDDRLKVTPILQSLADALLNVAKYSPKAFADHRERITALLDSNNPYLTINSVRATFEYLDQLNI